MDFLPVIPRYTQKGCILPTLPTEPGATNGWLGYWALGATIIFTITVFVFEAVLDVRQRQSYMKTEFPKQLEAVVTKIDSEIQNENTKSDVADENDEMADDKDNKNTAASTTNTKKDLFLPQLESKFEKSQLYGMDKITLSIVSSTYDTCETVAFLLLGFLPWAWDVATSLGHAGFTIGNRWIVVESEIGVSLIFLLVVQLVSMVSSLPFELYSTFHIEKKHGFNKQTIGLFITDKIKGLILSFAIGCPFVALLLYIIQKGGDYFYLYVWAFMFVFSLFMMTIVPVFIMPLFNKYEPLSDGALKHRIYAMADRLKYPLKKLFVMDGSKRSAHSNAFMFGFGKNKRIVLFDTLMEQVYDDEILAILGHELGHWKLGHTLTNFAVTQVYMGVAFYSFSLCYGDAELYDAFGFDGRNTATLIALLLFFQTLWAPVDKILSFLLTVFSRFCEFAADKFSVDLGMSKDLQTGLCKIHLENLGAMCPDPWYSTYHYSHPPLVERLSAMMQLDKKWK